jgi:hypothetical protein
VRAAAPGVENSHDASAAWYKENYAIDGAVDFFERGPDTYVRLSHPNGRLSPCCMCVSGAALSYGAVCVFE